MREQCPVCQAVGDKVTAVVGRGIVTAGPLNPAIDDNLPFSDVGLDVDLTSGLATALARPLEPKRVKPRASCLRLVVTSVLSVTMLAPLLLGVLSALIVTGQVAIGRGLGSWGVLITVALLTSGGGGLVGVLAPTILWYRHESARLAARYSRDLQAYVVAMEVYDRLRYCSRDDLCYDPATSDSFRPQAMLQVLEQVGYDQLLQGDSSRKQPSLGLAV